MSDLDVIKQHLGAYECQGWPSALTVCCDESCSITYPINAGPLDGQHFTSLQECADAIRALPPSVNGG